MNQYAIERKKIIRRATEILSQCRTLASDGKTPVYIPDAQSYYKGVYWRDFCYAMEGYGEMLPLEDVKATIRYILEPPFLDGQIFPKSRLDDGTLQYNWQYPFPKWCSADNPMFAVKVLHEYIKRGGEKELFKNYASKIEQGLDSIQLSSRSLVEDPVGPYIYGFYDTVDLTGEETFASVLYLDAAKRLGELYRLLNHASSAEKWETTAAKVQAGLHCLWMEDASMFMSDTGANRQIDVWGSAYAVYAGAVTEDMAMKISGWFTGNYNRCVKWGHVRHIPAPDYWKKTGIDAPPPGQYQNGAYWAVPVPWVVHALAMSDRNIAARMVKSFAISLLQFDFPECINEDGSCKLPGYLASAGMGLLGIGMLHDSQ